MKIDLHTHTQYSYDADAGTVEENVRAAIDRGLDILGITEHVDFFREAEDIVADIDAEQSDLLRCRGTYRDRITLLAGVEIGQPHASPAAADAFLKKYSFDYVIGSLHAMPNDVDLYFHEYDKLDCDRLLHAYFDEVEAMLQYGRFQVLGHIDYPLRVMKLPDNHPSFAGYMDRVEVILRILIDRGIALESNGKGLLSWQKEVGPELFVLERYRELGGELLTVGSDSHAPATIGNGTDRALERLRSVGFRYVHMFKDGRPVGLPL